MWNTGRPREVGLFHLVCYLRDGDRVFESYWTTRRGAEAMDFNYAPHGRARWPQEVGNHDM